MTLREQLRESIRRAALNQSQDLLLFMVEIDQLSDAELLLKLEKIYTSTTIFKSFNHFLAEELGLGVDKGVYVCYGHCTITKNGLITRAESYEEVIELMSFFGQYNVGWLHAVVVRLCDDSGDVAVAKKILSTANEKYPMIRRMIISDDIEDWMFQYCPISVLRCSMSDSL